MPTDETARPNQGVVLVIDKDGTVRQFLTLALLRVGYNVIPAHDTREARALFREHAPGLALIMIEIDLSTESGPEFIESLPTRHPRIPVVFTTARGSLELPSELPGPLLVKPFKASALYSMVRENALIGAH
jgi:DNA-binding NtrC family response regulator